MKLAFRSTPGMPSYHVSANNVSKDGGTYDFGKKEAERLLRVFPQNWFNPSAVEKQLQDEADQAKQDAEDAKTALPAGHPVRAGDVTGVNLEHLSEAEANIYKEAARKVDAGEELNDKETAILEKVEAIDAT